jgi:FlaA1/EpsC-like NDP-sugar epimerase
MAAHVSSKSQGQRSAATSIRIVGDISQATVAPISGERAAASRVAPRARKVWSSTLRRTRRMIAVARQRSRTDLGRNVPPGRRFVSGQSGAVRKDPTQSVDQRRWLLVGDGQRSRLLVEQMAADGQKSPVSVVVSESSRAEARAAGLPVGGSVDHLPAIARRLRVERVVIVVEDVGVETAERAHNLAAEQGLEVKLIEPLTHAKFKSADLDAVLAQSMDHAAPLAS